jgi:hypothetical protein
MSNEPHPAPDLPIPPMDHGSGWKDTAFTWAMGELILTRIGAGETVKAITADPRMPAYCTVFRWMQVVPAFGEAVAQVRAQLAANRLAERDALRRLRGRRRRGGRRPMVPAQALGQLLSDLRNGASVSEAVRRPGAPSFKALYTRVRGCPGFRAAFIDACDWRDGWLAFNAEHLVPDKVWLMGIQATNAEIRSLLARKGRLTPKLYRKMG